MIGKRMIAMCIGILFICQISNVFGSSSIGNDPEIMDATNDVYGFLGRQCRWGLFRQIDITSAWFFEDPEEPEYLQIMLEIQNYRRSLFLAFYAVNWTLNGTRYSSIFLTRFGGTSVMSSVMEIETGFSYPIYTTVDIMQNQIHFRIWKEYIGNPLPGTVCSELQAWAAVSIAGLVFSWDDIAPNIGWGEEYIIAY
jgi:hypothetical protein